jgi:hypothetical protein
MTTTTQTPEPQTPEPQQPIKEPLSLSQDVQFLILLLTIEGLLQEQETFWTTSLGPGLDRVKAIKTKCEQLGLSYESMIMRAKYIKTGKLIPELQ